MFDSFDDVHNGVAFRMRQRIIPQPVIMLTHGIECRTAGMVAVRDETGRNSRSIDAHASSVAVQRVEQRSGFLAIRLWGHKCTAVAQRVKVPDAPDVIHAEAIHPGEDSRLEGYPLRDAAKELRPEADAVLIGYLCGGNLMLRCNQNSFCGGKSGTVLRLMLFSSFIYWAGDKLRA